MWWPCLTPALHVSSPNEIHLLPVYISWTSPPPVGCSLAHVMLPLSPNKMYVHNFCLGLRQHLKRFTQQPGGMQSMNMKSHLTILLQNVLYQEARGITQRKQPAHCLKKFFNYHWTTYWGHRWRETTTSMTVCELHQQPLKTIKKSVNL
jgi:hypothetical protein